MSENPQFVTVTIDGVVHSDIVPRGYRIDTETEELLYADELEDGMRVLVETGRGDETQSEYVASTIIAKNRWCRVTKFRAAESVAFVALYDDGHKMVRTAHNIEGWIVKKDSIPEKNDEDYQKDQDEKIEGFFRPGKVSYPSGPKMLQFGPEFGSGLEADVERISTVQETNKPFRRRPY